MVTLTVLYFIKVKQARQPDSSSIINPVRGGHCIIIFLEQDIENLEFLDMVLLFTPCARDCDLLTLASPVVLVTL